jgi:hypothetical protein
MLKLMQELVSVRQKAVFDDVIRRLGLDKFWNYVQINNPSGQLPYHNNEHMYNVARVAYELYCEDHVIDGNFAIAEARVLIVAGLIHDYDHSGGKQPDNENIKRHVSKVSYLAKRGLIENFSEEDWKGVKQLIRSTEFPHKDREWHDLQDYIRDADFMYSLEIHSLRPIMHGISEELTHKLGRVMEPAEFIVAQRKFLGEVRMYSQPGQRIWGKARDAAETLQNEYAAQS